jgi:hypothetical protein
MLKRPNALIIGAGKAGSTSLHNYLGAHPAICGSKTKELMFFTAHFGKGEGWYRSHFPDQDGIDIYFESTPQYSFRDEFPFVPGRIHSYNPKMKLIYIVRHPIERIISHFNHWRRAQPERFSNIETMLRDPQERAYFINRTRYFHQIEAYRAMFPDEQLHVVFLEDIQSDFTATLNRVFRFLGVGEGAETVEATVYNKGATQKQGRRFGDGISEQSQKNLCQTLSGDVQKLLSYCRKPGDFWGAAFQ